MTNRATTSQTVTSIPNADNQTTVVTETAQAPFDSTPATTLVEPSSSSKTPAEIELEKRRARAAKFGIPFVEPTTATTTTKGSQKKEAASNAAATVSGPSEEALAKRREKWGVVDKPGAIKRVNGKVVEKTATPAKPASQVTCLAVYSTPSLLYPDLANAFISTVPSKRHPPSLKKNVNEKLVQRGSKLPLQYRAATVLRLSLIHI